MSKCYNGGTCKEAVYSSDFICQCPPGFTGTQCQISKSSAKTDIYHCLELFSYTHFTYLSILFCFVYLLVKSISLTILALFATQFVITSMKYYFLYYYVLVN